MRFLEENGELSLRLWVNGSEHTVLCHPQDRLVDVLRGKLGLTGTKEGCGVGECGACTVILDGQAVNSCMLLATQAVGHQIETIEGIGTAQSPHALQKSFVENHAISCGFCTPGFIMSAKALLDENSSPAQQEILEAVEGNLCRCTGYATIVNAIEQAAASHE